MIQAEIKLEYILHDSKLLVIMISRNAIFEDIFCFSSASSVIGKIVTIPRLVQCTEEGTQKSAQTVRCYTDVIMGAIASEITSLTIVYSTVYSDADQRKH